MIANVEQHKARNKLMEFNEKVLFVRATLKLSQNKLAEELKVGVATINRWETKKTKPNKRDAYAFELYCKKHDVKFIGEENK